MAFNSFGEFLAMGNHGFYVWLAYGLTFLVLVGLAWHSVHTHSKTRRELVAQRKRSQRHAAGRDLSNDLEAGL